MAQIDVSDLLLDPDFCDKAQLIQRASQVNEFGELELIEAVLSPDPSAVVQAPTPDTLKFLPEGVKYQDTIDVWLSGQITELHTQVEYGYSDVLVWKGKRYAAVAMVEDFGNFGAGFTHAIFAKEGAPHAQ